MQVPPSPEYLFDTLRRVTDRLRLYKPDSTSGSGASGYRRQSNTCALAELGVQVAHGGAAGGGSPHSLELMAEQVIPAVSGF